MLKVPLNINQHPVSFRFSCLIPSTLHKTPCWWCHTL